MSGCPFLLPLIQSGWDYWIQVGNSAKEESLGLGPGTRYCSVSEVMANDPEWYCYPGCPKRGRQDTPQGSQEKMAVVVQCGLLFGKVASR